MIPCLIFVALRSTGPDATHDRLIQLTAEVRNPTSEPKAFNAHVNPGPTHVNPQLEHTLYLPVGTLATKPHSGAVLESFFRYCKAMAGERAVVLVGQNAHHFQWPLLTQELRRSRLAIPNHFNLWDSLHAIQPFYEQGRLSSCRPREIVRGWGHTFLPGPKGDIQALLVVLNALSANAGPNATRVYSLSGLYHLLQNTNERYIKAQKQNKSNQFATRRMEVNRAENPHPSPEASTPAYDPDFIPDPVSLPEPPPAASGLEVYDQLCRWMDHHYPEKTQDVLNFAELIQKRHNYGKQKYNQALMTGDGRDDLEDARQELGDLAMYATKALMNHHDVSELRGFLEIVGSLLQNEVFFKEPATEVLKDEVLKEIEEPEEKKFEKPEETKTVDQPEEIKTVDQPIEKTEEIKTVDQPEEIKTVDQPEEIKTVDQPEEIKTVDQPEETSVKSSERKWGHGIDQ